MTAVAARPFADVGATPARPARTRVESVDVVRGVIMILMALDHTRDYFGDVTASPANLATTTVALFFTRWITHFCAPVFFLLTGTGAYLALARRGRAGLSRFLLTRGLWLIVLELTVMRFLWQFNVDYRLTLLTVLWALGWSMIVLAALVWLPASVTTAIGAVMIVTHNLLDAVTPASLGVLARAVAVLHAPSMLLPGEHTVFSTYVLVPWVGVTAVGYGLGQLFTWPTERRRAFLSRLGVGCIMAFVVLRTVNLYGDPLKWSPQRSALFTLMSFINANKYPPSLLFLLMTLGPALLLMRAVDGRTPDWLRPALIIGRVPLFYFMMHVLLIHLATVVASYARYGTAHWMVESPTLDRFPVTQPPGWPVPLPVVYLVWIGVVLALYPMCRWFAALKARRSDVWLSYL
ncbi:MAG: hypothetical protein JWL95_1635 [Gemmatimonadetes bacterium]|nr:hypothetical protein [Gemmatimonadota bacterium]